MAGLAYAVVTATGAQPDARNVACPWQLANRRGIRYLQVWAADRAGNISPQPKRSYINYVPATLQVDANAPILRYELREGDGIAIRVQPLSGDPDIYLWAPDALTLPRAPWYSNGGGAQTDRLNVVAPDRLARMSWRSLAPPLRSSRWRCRSRRQM